MSNGIHYKIEEKGDLELYSSIDRRVCDTYSALKFNEADAME